MFERRNRKLKSETQSNIHADVLFIRRNIEPAVEEDEVTQQNLSRHSVSTGFPIEYIIK